MKRIAAGPGSTAVTASQCLLGFPLDRGLNAHRHVISREPFNPSAERRSSFDLRIKIERASGDREASKLMCSMVVSLKP